MNHLSRLAIPALACACLAPLPALSAVTAAECAAANQMSFVQQRVATVAAQGVAPLRRFVQRTQLIYQLNMLEVAAWLDERQALKQACVGVAPQ